MSGPAQRGHPGASASRSNTACGDAADRTVISYEEVVTARRQPADTSLTGTTRHCGVAGSSFGRRKRQNIVPRRCPPVSIQLATPGSRSEITMRYVAAVAELHLRRVQRRSPRPVLERLHVRVPQHHVGEVATAGMVPSMTNASSGRRSNVPDE